MLPGSGVQVLAYKNRPFGPVYSSKVWGFEYSNKLISSCVNPSSSQNKQKCHPDLVAWYVKSLSDSSCLEHNQHSGHVKRMLAIFFGYTIKQLKESLNWQSYFFLLNFLVWKCSVHVEIDHFFVLLERGLLWKFAKLLRKFSKIQIIFALIYVKN